MRRPVAAAVGVLFVLVVLTACGGPDPTLAEQQQRPPTWTELVEPLIPWAGFGLLFVAIGFADYLSNRRGK